MGRHKTKTQELAPPGPIAYLMPEFPGQTHVWFWREVIHMREWGIDLRLFSTRPPPEETAARHAFAERAREETTYLWPRPLTSILSAAAWGLKRPRRLAQAATIPFRLDGMSLRERATTVPLLVAACVLAREAVSQNIRHIHVHMAARSAVIALMVRRLSGLPYSLTMHGDLDWWGGGMGSKLANAEFTVAVAEWLRDDILREYPRIPPSAVIVASMGVDTRRWAPAEPRSHDSTFRLATVSRLYYAKGHDLLFSAVARLRDSGRDVQLLVVGAGPERDALQSLARRLQLNDRIEFAGSLGEDEIIARLHGVDAFVLASRSEPLGVVYMEAMALGLPTVGTDSGGVTEIITNGRDGLVVPPEDEERLAGAIAQLMDDSELRRRLASSARQTIVDRFDSRIGAALLYERLFGIPPPRANGDDH
jgi:glycosyltransferase involved in cell wall biosynthesis